MHRVPTPEASTSWATEPKASPMANALIWKTDHGNKIVGIDYFISEAAAARRLKELQQADNTARVSTAVLPLPLGATVYDNEGNRIDPTQWFTFEDILKQK